MMSLSKLGGAENFVVWYASALVERGYDVTIITEDFKASYWPERFTCNLKIECTPYMKLNKNPFFFEYYGYRILQAVKNYDIVINHLWLNSSIYLSFAKKNQIWEWYCQEPPRFIYYKEIDNELRKYWANRDYYTTSTIVNKIKNQATKDLLPFLKILDKKYVNRVFSKVAVNSNFTAKNFYYVYGNRPLVVPCGAISNYSTNSFHDKKDDLGCDFLILSVGG